MNLIEPLLSRFRKFFLYEMHHDRCIHRFVIERRGQCKKVWTKKREKRRNAKKRGSRRVAKNDAEGFLTTVGSKEGNAKGDGGGTGLKDIEYEYSTRAATAGEVAVDVLATLSATSYVSFPFHFQSLLEEFRNQKPRIFLAAGANKDTYASPLTPTLPPSVC